MAVIQPITQTQIEELPITIGFRLKLEDKAFEALPELLKRDHNLIVQERLNRQWVKDNEDNMIEVNIIGKAIKDGKEIEIIGEAKNQLSKKDVDDFIRKKLKRLEGLYKEIFPVLVTHMTSEYDIEEYAKAKGIIIYYCYDF